MFFSLLWFFTVRGKGKGILQKRLFRRQSVTRAFRVLAPHACPKERVSVGALCRVRLTHVRLAQKLCGMRQRTERATQNVSGDEKRQSAVTKNVTRIAVAPGWSVSALRVDTVRAGTRGRSHSARPLVWSVAVRGPFGRSARASGRTNTRERALARARRAAWRLSGGVGRVPDGSGRTRSRSGTHRGTQGVAVECNGVLWRVDALVSGACGARQACARLGLRRKSAPRLSPDGTHWLCPVVRSSRAQLERLASQDRPPRRAGGPRLPPLATRWMPASGTVTLQRRAKHYADPDDWPTDESATQEADLPPDDDGAWGQ